MRAVMLRPAESMLNRHGQRLRQALSDSLALLEWLEAESFQTIGLAIEPERRPVVNIALSAKCTWLKEKYKAYKHVISNTHVTWRADIMHCRVQWVEGGH